MDATTLLGILRPLVPGIPFEEVPAPDYPTLLVPREHIVEACRVLRDTPDLSFTCLVDLIGVDVYPRDPRFEIVYHLVCLGERDLPRQGSALPPARLRLKVRVSGQDAHVPTLSGVFPNAGWPEREIYDLFGIVFDGHPDLRRILMPDDWEGHPLRKDYPVQVKVPYKSFESVQVTEEEFVSTLTRHRLTSRPAKRPS